MPQREGILDHKDWEEVKQEWEVKTAWQPTWQPSAQRPPSRIARAARTLLLWPKPSERAPEKLRRTAWLDGLRGFAAFLVYWHHHVLWAHGVHQKNLFESGFGAVDNMYRFAALPVVRHFFTGGHFAVSAFFVISGYVLSTKPLSLIHGGELLPLGDNIASALFRRWLRLFLPLAATTFVYMTAWHVLGVWCDGANPAGNWYDDAWQWYYEFKNFSFVYNSGGSPWFTYNMHSWSIPIEFRGSIVVYTSLLAFSRCSRNARLWCEAGLAVYFLYVADGWYCALFAAGMLLCDLDLLALSGQLPRPLARLAPAKLFVFYHLLAASLYLGGVPSVTADVSDLRKARGWYYLSLLKPQAVFDYKWFYLFWAATFLVASTPRIRWLKGFFETRFCQHLGRISYALYLVHGPVLWILGDRIYAAVGWYGPAQEEHIPQWVGKSPLSKAGPMGLEVGFLLPHLILLPVTFWMAEMATRLFDEPAVHFAQWLYRRAMGRQIEKA